MTYIIEAPKDVISWVIHLMRLLKNWVTFLIYGAVQQYILAAPFCSSVKQPHNILIKWNGFTAILAAEADLNHHDVRSSQGTPSFLVDFGVHHFFLWFYTSLHLNTWVYLYNLHSSVTGKYETDVSVSLSCWVFLINEISCTLLYFSPRVFSTFLLLLQAVKNKKKCTKHFPFSKCLPPYTVSTRSKSQNT